MNPLIYKVIHIIGILGLFTAMGSIMASDRKKPVMMTKFVIIHGISLIVILISGFGMQAKMGLDFSGWLIAKVVVWFLLGGCLVILKRGLLSATLCWLIIIALGGIAGYLAIFKSAHLSFLG